MCILNIVSLDLSQCFFVVVEYVGRDWRFLGRQLNLSQFDFEQIVEQHPRNLREQVQCVYDMHFFHTISRVFKFGRINFEFSFSE